MGSKAASFAAGAIAALVISGGTAVAATGGSFILGKSNTAGTTTSLKNPNGTALALAGKGPALRVNSGARIPLLNADRVDGLDASAFAKVAGATAYKRVVGEWIDLDSDGTNDIIVAVAQCPSGSRLTGGGYTDFTASGTVVDNSPAGGRSWVVAAWADPAVDAGSDLEAYAVCYNPRGAVGGGTTLARTGGDAEETYLHRLGRLAPKN